MTPSITLSPLASTILHAKARLLDLRPQCLTPFLLPSTPLFRALLRNSRFRPSQLDLTQLILRPLSGTLRPLGTFHLSVTDHRGRQVIPQHPRHCRTELLVDSRVF